MFIRFFNISFVLVSLALAQTANAQAYGGDMITQEMAANGLFIAHTNNCDATTEVFFHVGSNSLKGFCIEKTERTAATWLDARQACATDTKRLPELPEFVSACQSPPSGLVNMTGNLEWVSNYFYNSIDTSNWNYHFTSVAGLTGCTYADVGIVATNNPSLTPLAYAFRCVR